MKLTASPELAGQPAFFWAPKRVRRCAAAAPPVFHVGAR